MNKSAKEFIYNFVILIMIIIIIKLINLGKGIIINNTIIYHQHIIFHLVNHISHHCTNEIIKILLIYKYATLVLIVYYFKLTNKLIE